ncbi:YlmC/YmxH family sporulation protein [Oceanobacillus sp. FSL H7-0719]|uniref:YlmC/YmxH family sporulation protein n=1 Tax=Oceanobacillus sp. FSL H7-0719 TaxID=2954507 RepID=UPI003251D01D
MIRLSELQVKEVISIVDGRRLGFIIDLDIDVKTGKIIALILADQENKSHMFGKTEEIRVLWQQILRIGSDVILVKEAYDQRTLMLP